MADEQRTEPGGEGGGPGGEGAAGGEAGEEAGAGAAGAGERSAGEEDEERSRAWGSPFAEIQELVTDVVEGALRGFSTVGGARFPRHDLVQLPDEGYLLLVDVPGVARDDVEVTTVGDELTVSGQRRRPELPEGAEVVRSERGYGRFRRSLRLPADVDPAGIRAKLEEGVLRVTLPRRTEPERQRVEIS